MKKLNTIKATLSRLRDIKSFLFPNLLGVLKHPPGHFYSPLLNLRDLPTIIRMDQNGWANVLLNQERQLEVYQHILVPQGHTAFPQHKEDGRFYYWNNSYFTLADATILSGMLKLIKPQKVIEIGSGFSSAAMLDTKNLENLTTEFVFIEPFPARLYSLCSNNTEHRVITKPLQEVALNEFASLARNDILFIDSSHVAKVGSDVTFLWLQVLPLLKPGVLVHIHDVFYNTSYPVDWLASGRAWNENLMVKAVLANSTTYSILAFNSYFQEKLASKFPDYDLSGGGSLWLQKQ